MLHRVFTVLTALTMSFGVCCGITNAEVLVEFSEEDGTLFILGDAESNYTDIAFAALSGLWMQSRGYGGGKAEDNLIERDRLPARMRTDIERWIEDFPKATTFVTRLYAEER